MQQIFISDLHLDESTARLRAGFSRFLEEKCEKSDEIYILGDFFEVWLGDDHDSPFNTGVIDTLAALNADVFIMHGNRDFLIGERFCQRAGATLLNDPSIIETVQGQALVMHGDSLCTRDTAYMTAREQLRSRAFQADFLSRPIEERDAFARKLRGESQTHTRQTAIEIMDVTPEEVEREMIDAGVSVLIHGHTHRPSVHELQLPNGPAKRFVLGDWHESMHYLEINDEGAALKKYTL